MQDLKSKLDKLLAEAIDCEMIGNLATDKAKRELFRKLAVDLRSMAHDIEAVIAARAKAMTGHEPISEASRPPGQVR